MEIKSAITNHEILEKTYKSPNCYSDYFYIGAWVSVAIIINDIRHDACLQTGLSYDHNDYGCPTNNLDIYDEGSSELLWRINRQCESDFSDTETVFEINQECGTDFTGDQMADIYRSIIEISTEAQFIIDAAKIEAEEELENDDNTYVCLIPRENVEVDDGVWQIQQCEAEQLKIFDDKEEADDFISNLTIDHAYVISTEAARSRFPEEF